MTVDASRGSLRLSRLGRRAVIVVGAAWAVVLGAILRHSLFISHDSMSNYGHVWWVAEQLRAGQGLPFRMPVIGHGEALTFPYGFLPWLVAGVLWAVPEVRHGWWAVAVLLNPTLVMAPIIGQLPFLWATAFFFVAVGLWRREKRIGAVVMLALAQATHPAILIPIAMIVVAVWFYWEPRKRALLVSYVCALLVSLPAAYLVFDSPVMEDTSIATKIGNFAATLAVRIFVVAVPLVLAALRNSGVQWLPRKLVRRGMEPYALGTVAIAIILNLVFLQPFELTWAWAGLARRPDKTLAEFARSSDFTPGITYRVLRAGDGKVGMYQLLKAGGHLDSEFFPESIARHSFPNLAVYSTFLRRRAVDTVIVFNNYDVRWKTNEHELLEQLVSEDHCSATQVGATVLQRFERFDVYRIQRAC